MRLRLNLATLLSALLLASCAQRVTNAPLAQINPTAGYRFQLLAHTNNSDSLLIILAFSGGGTRAAALSYGVLEELAKTQITWEGRQKRLLDEVDLISSVSGGSFTAAYYGLYGDRLFQDFESKFLKRNIEDRLWWLYCYPPNWFRLPSPHYDRIDMVADYYNRHLFENHTYADLRQRPRPYIMINATDMTLESRFEFTQDQFDLINSDLSSFPVASAVAASSAYPIILSPLSLKNYSPTNAVNEPEWVTAALDARTRTSARRRTRALEARSYLSSEKRPYIHLLDGGLSDNLGLRGPLDAMLAQENAWQTMRLFKVEDLRKMVLIVVNASATPNNGSDKHEKAPGILEVITTAGRVPINRYSFETVELFKQNFEAWAQSIRENRRKLNNTPQLRAPGPIKAPPDDLEFYTVEVSLDALADEKERHYCSHLPTSLKLPGEAVDHLRAAAATLLRQSDSYQKLLRDLRAAPLR